ncbi:hypothetical protein llap_3564 [Limosa lapponica baueri]|uniref:Uncharacterized protein n=1 Tax=Limosa lapponica baueri TaxID=1758121 RepID=A0A2I0UJB9_LIMLA|nr:hypothetical protein llap_3564 [Limosa lapponica baueri]
MVPSSNGTTEFCLGQCPWQEYRSLLVARLLSAESQLNVPSLYQATCDTVKELPVNDKAGNKHIVQKLFSLTVIRPDYTKEWYADRPLLILIAITTKELMGRRNTLTNSVSKTHQNMSQGESSVRSQCHVPRFSRNFTRLPQLLKYDGWWLDNFILQFPPDLQMNLMRSRGFVHLQVP